MSIRPNHNPFCCIPHCILLYSHIYYRYFRQGTLLHHYGEVLAILMRLRQICCHPRLVGRAAIILQESAEQAGKGTKTSNGLSGGISPYT